MPSILSSYPEYEVNIGIEVHVQLVTNSKIFCACSNAVVKEPNTTICEICAGYPGTLPVLNKKVVDYAIMAGLATNCAIAPISQFARKHYFYPDLPKGFQITQHTMPICEEGYVTIYVSDNTIKKIRLIRIHMEEDAGKSMHASRTKESFVDLNRAGTSLLEIVSYPDISSAEEARAYLKELRLIVQYLGISTGNMEEGAFRADTNISVKKKGSTTLGTRCELKNINSFKFISDAIEYEIERQILLLEEGKKVIQETRLWDPQKKETFSMRSKEEAADYRYFPEPDLPLIEVATKWIEEMRAHLPELPRARFTRYLSEYKLTPYEAGILIEDRVLARYFEEAYSHYAGNKLIHWVLRDILGYLNDEKITLSECKITPEKLAGLIKSLDEGVINNTSAKKVFSLMAQIGKDSATIIEEYNFAQVGSQGELETLVKEIVAAYPQQVEQYRAGKDKLFGFFVGQVMKRTEGKADPKVLNRLLKTFLDGK